MNPIHTSRRPGGCAGHGGRLTRPSAATAAPQQGPVVPEHEALIRRIRPYQIQVLNIGVPWPVWRPLGWADWVGWPLGRHRLVVPCWLGWPLGRRRLVVPHWLGWPPHLDIEGVEGVSDRLVVQCRDVV